MRSRCLMAGIRKAHNGNAGRPPMCSPLRGLKLCSRSVLPAHSRVKYPKCQQNQKHMDGGGRS
jgi:hypothetical protein